MARPHKTKETIVTENKEIVRLLYAGFTNRQIAEKLGLAESTVSDRIVQTREGHLRDYTNQDKPFRATMRAIALEDMSFVREKALDIVNDPNSSKTDVMAALDRIVKARQSISSLMVHGPTYFRLVPTSEGKPLELVDKQREEDRNATNNELIDSRPDVGDGEEALQLQVPVDKESETDDPETVC